MHLSLLIVRAAHLIERLRKDQSGAAAIEYALIASLVSIAIVGALGTLAGGLNTVFGDVAAALTP